MPKPERRRRIRELLDYVGLGDREQSMAGQLSGGLKRRLMIARALMHGPHVLILDEPPVGLDTQTRRRIWELIRKMNKDGMTVLLTTHYIEALPLTHASQALRAIALGQGFPAVSLAVLLGYSLVLFAGSVMVVQRVK